MILNNTTETRQDLIDNEKAGFFFSLIAYNSFKHSAHCVAAGAKWNVFQRSQSHLQDGRHLFCVAVII